MMCLIMLPGIVRRERREQREQGADAAAGRGTHAAQAAAGQRKQEVGGARWRRGRDHRGREASTRGDAGAMECGGEMKGEAFASTIGKGASARSFEGGASASTISKGATPRSAKGGGIRQHDRRRSRCNTCKADKDDSMPPGLEEL